MGANYRQGETLMVDYTPVADLEGGSIVAINGLLAVIHSDLTSGEAQAASFPNGNAVYEVTKTTTADVFAVDDLVDGTAGVTAAASTADLTTAGDDRLGVCVKASSATDTTVWCVLSSGI
jgi:predicted RecA/RadA family phage recombinase